MSIDDGHAPGFRDTTVGDLGRSCISCIRNGGEHCKLYAKEFCGDKSICDNCMTAADLAAEIEVPEVYTPGVVKYSDTDNADRFVKINGKDIKYAVEEDKFYIWNGHEWERDVKNQTGSMIKKMLTTLKEEEEENYNDAMDGYSEAKDNGESRAVLEEWLKAAATAKAYLKKLTNSGTFDNAMRRCQRDYANVKVKLTDFDQNKHLFNAENITLDLSPQTMLENKGPVVLAQRREDMITRRAPVKYDPTISPKPYVDMLNDVFYGNKELIRHHLQVRGLGLTGYTVKNLFISLGAPDSGKSTIKNIEHEVYGDVDLGGYSKETSIDAFLKRNFAGELRADLISLRAARMVWTSEADRSMQLDEELVKKMTGKDTITARGPYMRSEIAYEPMFKINMLANDAPYMRPDNDGMMNRVQIIPYMVKFTAHPNPNLPMEKGIDVERIRYFSTPEGKSCILNAWIAGLMGYYIANELTQVQAIKDKTAAYKNELDNIKLFKELAIVFADDHIVKHDLYLAYRSFMQEEGLSDRYIMQEKKFNGQIKKILDAAYPDRKVEGFDTKGKFRVWFGMRLRSDVDKVSEEFGEHVRET